MSHYQHWSDGLARAVAQRVQKESAEAAICAAGISPSGTVHIGNFREIITVDLVVRALRDAGVRTRFLYFWDDYDALRAVPPLLDEGWEAHVRKPLSAIPAPDCEDESYAQVHEKEVEGLLPQLGIEAEYISQTERYQSHRYVEMMRLALQERAAIRAILNQYRATPLGEDWWPLTVYSSFSGKDTTQITGWDNEWTITYFCEESGRSESLDVRTAGNVKLRWRIDWPMRWRHSGVDFEPAGKDHHSEGGSYDTARQIATRVFDIVPPISVQYDFVRIKGGAGKMSSSKGELLSIRAVLAVYQPEIVRYLFASTRPNAEFAISFDADVIKIYEDYDTCERIACGLVSASDKQRAKAQRIYELSQVGDMPAPDSCVQIAFRHLCNVLQVHNGDVAGALATFPEYAGMDDTMKLRIRRRAACAWHWITTYAPPHFCFQLSAPDGEAAYGGGDAQGRSLGEGERTMLWRVAAVIADYDMHDSGEEAARGLHNALYAIASESEVPFRELCRILYRIMIGRDDGPRLAHFMLLVGKETLLRYFRRERIEPSAGQG